MTTAAAEPITFRQGKLNVPSHPIVPFIEGDGTGPDIWRAAQRVFDAGVEKAYGGKRSVAWKEVLAGEKAHQQTGSWLPDATLEAFREYLVGIKGPLTTPVGGGIRSLNVALRQILGSDGCQGPAHGNEGVRTPAHKLIHFYRIDEWELYDLERDPDEMQSVYDDPAYAEVQAELKEELERLREAYAVTGEADREFDAMLEEARRRRGN